MKGKCLLSACILATSFATVGNAQATSDKLDEILTRLEHRVPHHAGFYERVAPVMDAKAKTTQTISRLKSYVFKEFDNGAFINRDTTVFTYLGLQTGDWDGEMNYKSYIRRKYDNAGLVHGAWESGTKNYNANDDVTDNLIQRWNDNITTYENYENYTTLYDSLGRKKTEREQHWDASLMTWANDSLFEYTYDTLHQVIAMEGKIWNPASNTWRVRHRFAYTYDPTGQIASETYQLWDTTQVNWKNVSRYKYVYNNNRIMTADYEEFHAVTSQWRDNTFYDYAYNAAGDNTSITVKTWDQGLNGYQDFMKYNYTYDANHNALSEVVQVWNGAYINDTRTQFTYNSFDQPLTIVNDMWDGAAWVHDNNSMRYNLFYEIVTNSIAGVAEENKANIYPSPATDYVQVDLDWKTTKTLMLSVFDAQGRVLKQQTTNEKSTRISVNDLPAGSYWIRINGQNDNIVKQILVVH